MIAIEALLRTMKDHLPQIPLFEERVFYDQAPQGTAYPYCVFVPVSGGGENQRAGKDTADIVLQVTCFAEDVLIALQGVDMINKMLKNQGEQEQGGISAVNHGWKITTITPQNSIFTTEIYEGVKPIYQHGKEYRFIMEEI